MAGDEMPSICALIAARNEHQYLRILLPLLRDQSIDVVMIDHGSTDESQDLYAAFCPSPIIQLLQLEYRGTFSLSDQLSVKADAALRLKHDWIVHCDADEILEGEVPGTNLRQAIECAHHEGFNALNFEELVFIPHPGESLEGLDYHSRQGRYYYFAPGHSRLQRAWKRGAGLSNVSTGGHALDGSELRMSPRRHALRHYIVLSQDHAYRKYLGRRYDPIDLGKDWHANRLAMTLERLRLPENAAPLNTFDVSLTHDWCYERPCSKHYWDW